MANGNNYRTLRDGSWRLWVLAERWSPALWGSVLDRIAQQAPSKHPQTFFLAPGESRRGYYLKTFYPYTTRNLLKDSFRLSKARRAQQVGAELAAAGFQVPVAVAVGEKRTRGLTECAFLLTDPVPGVSLVEALDRHHRRTKGAAGGVEKRSALVQLAAELRRFHDLGFVHGDLVATNIFVDRGAAGQWHFWFMDNDRTRRYPQSLPQSQWKRNLVQLNRIPLPGISLQDRMRFLAAYLGNELTPKRAAALARWLEEKTRKRRWECDRATGESFRSLMRWENPSSEGVKLA